MLKALFNGGEEGKARMEGRRHDKEAASSKFNTSIQKSIPYSGLEITAGQRTMSGLIVDLTGQTFVLPVMLTGQNSIVLKMK